jgi:hypothetical protein
MKALCTATVAAVLLAVPGCGSEVEGFQDPDSGTDGGTDADTDSDTDSDSDTDDTDSYDEWYVLGPDHTGWAGDGSWENKDCYLAGCHTTADLPASHDEGWSLPTCADCHGGNGAPSPPSNHTEGWNCTQLPGCHGGSMHGSYDVNDDCTSCHFAFAGNT